MATPCGRGGIRFVRFPIRSGRAAIALGIVREWAYVPIRMADCPACGEKVKPGVAVCRLCRAILDQEKAANHGRGLGAATTDDRRVRPHGGEKSKG
jgi:hypothetical protein